MMTSSKYGAILIVFNEIKDNNYVSDYAPSLKSLAFVVGILAFNPHNNLQSVQHIFLSFTKSEWHIESIKIELIDGFIILLSLLSLYFEFFL